MNEPNQEEEGQGLEGNPESATLYENFENNEEGEGQEEEEEEEEEDLPIVLNPSGEGSGQVPSPAFGRQHFFRSGSNNSLTGSSPQKTGPPNAPFSVKLATQQPLLVSTPNQQKGVFDIDIDGLEEKPWRKPGADITDYFNYGFTEDTWKNYCQKQVELRLQQSMQGKIKVYESKTDQKPDEIIQTGIPTISDFAKKPLLPQPRRNPPPTLQPQQADRRRTRDQDDSVIQVLSGEDNSGQNLPPEAAKPVEGQIPPMIPHQFLPTPGQPPPPIGFDPRFMNMPMFQGRLPPGVPPFDKAPPKRPREHSPGDREKDDKDRRNRESDERSHRSSSSSSSSRNSPERKSSSSRSRDERDSHSSSSSSSRSSSSSSSSDHSKRSEKERSSSSSSSSSRSDKKEEPEDRSKKRRHN